MNTTRKKQKPVLIKEKGDWKQYWDPKFQKHFFYNTITKQTMWTKPNEFFNTKKVEPTPIVEDPDVVKKEEKKRNKEFSFELLAELRPQENRKSVADYMSDMFDIVQEISEEKRKIDEEERRKEIIKVYKSKEVEEEFASPIQSPVSEPDNLSPNVPSLKIKSPRKSPLDLEDEIIENSPQVEEVISPRMEKSPRAPIENEPPEKKSFGSFLSPKPEEKRVKRKGSLMAFLTPNNGNNEIKKGRSISFFGTKKSNESFTNVQSFQQPVNTPERVVKKKSFLSFLSPRGNEIKKSTTDIYKPDAPERKIFGTSLDDLMLHPSEKYQIPIVYQKIIDFLKTKTTKPKIFEKKGDLNNVEALIKEIEQKGEKFNFKSKTNVHDVTELFMMMISELPTKLVPEELIASFANIGKLDSSVQENSIKQFIHTVYKPTYIYSSRLFRKIIELLAAICKGSYYNQMNEYLLSKILVPKIFDLNSKNSHEKEYIETCFEILISKYKRIYMERETYRKDMSLSISKSIETLDKSDIIFESNQVMEVSSKNWKEMYLVLLEKAIYVYESNKKQNEDPVVILPLTKNTTVFSVTEDEFHPYSFCVEINGTSTIFESSTEDEREKWMKNILNQLQSEPTEEVVYSPRSPRNFKE
eukprot:gene7412-11735_t